MPQCYTLTRKGQTEPESRAKIDDEMCKHFGVTPDPKFWYMDWDNIVGFSLACGKTWDQIRENAKKLLAAARAATLTRA